MTNSHIVMHIARFVKSRNGVWPLFGIPVT